MSLLFNMLCRLVITFLPRSNCLNFMAAVTIWSDFRAPQNKVWHFFDCFSVYLPWSDGTGCHDLSFWMLSFKPAFSLPSFIKRLFSSSLLSAIRVVSSAYLRLLIFFPAIDISPGNWYFSQLVYCITLLFTIWCHGDLCETKFAYRTWNQIHLNFSMCVKILQSPILLLPLNFI